MAESGFTVDAEQVRQVIDFYARAATVVGDSATDIRQHDLGSWAVGEQYRELGARYRAMGEAIAARLSDHAVAADRLSMSLQRGLTVLVEAEEANAAGLSRPLQDIPGMIR